MKKVIKLTSGILASTLFLTNFSGLEVANATDLPLVKVENENSDIKTKVVEKNGKYYLTVEAIKDVANISIKVKVGNVSKVFKHAKALTLGESVEFEIELPKSLEKPAGKMLPKTEVFRETVELSATIKGQKLSVSVSYDIDKEVVEVAPAEEKASEDKAPLPAPVEEKEEVVAPTVPAPVAPAPEEKPAEPEVVRVSQPAVEETTMPQPAPASTPQPAVAQPTQPVVSDTSLRSVSNPVEPTVNGNFDQAAADEVLKLVNQYREANGRTPFTVNNSIASGTELRAGEFATLVNGSYSSPAELHKRLDGQAWHTAFAGLGKVSAENLAYSKHGAAALVNWWKSSPSHNAAMLNPEYKSISIKVLVKDGKYYGVQIFSK